MQLPAPRLFITATIIIVYYTSRQQDSITYSTNITGVDKGAQGAQLPPPLNGRAKKIFLLK